LGTQLPRSDSPEEQLLGDHHAWVDCACIYLSMKRTGSMELSFYRD
jgi:hypothetical protein